VGFASEGLSRAGILVLRAIWLAIAVAAVVYAGDTIFLRLRAAYPGLGSAFDTVLVERMYAIPLKNGRTEYEMDARQPELNVTCVRALFPHLGYQPCWYVRRNSQKPIPMVILPVARP
jgi:hypothetical protein